VPHGNTEGLGLTDGEFIEWKRLRASLTVINKVLQGELIVCMSSCFGAAAGKMAMTEYEVAPFRALVGNVCEAEWSDAAIGFVAFYHRLFKGADFPTALAAMKTASGDDHFSIEFGEETREKWTFLLAKIRAGELGEEIR